ncbi:hypothetical protein AO989_11640 [Pseudomonas aeruginosa]|nr:hypothetical protein AO905_11040 [Pseudomonas aeruginosa]KSJ13183.2 hypothetical protein AO989_11640 [Pseudomonas aeruginosa]KYQ69483.1 hypothetical protein AXH09_10430 [Pseudomonas aeruginosa]HBP5383679.1 hypothetical protein [Pseudomonas aeruginosa]
MCAEDPGGAYVDYSYFAALQAELAALKRQDPEADLMEPVYQFQWRKVGEGDWMACSHSWFRFCEASPENETRVVEVARPAQVAPQPEQSVFVEALERVKLTDEEARHHSASALAYWNNAVTACIAALSPQGGVSG